MALVPTKGKWSSIQSDTSGLRYVVNLMSPSAMICVWWFVRCGVRWYVLVFLFHLRQFSVTIYAQRIDLFKLRQSAETTHVDSLATAAY